MRVDTPNLGPQIRAARTGFRWSARHGSFIRITTSGRRNFIELCPANELPSSCKKQQYRCWWEEPGLIDMIPWLRQVRKIKRYVQYEIDDNGTIICEVKR